MKAIATIPHKMMKKLNI